MKSYFKNFWNLPISLIRLYQKIISPLFPPSCIYHPTCSEYAIQAIKKYGIFTGMLKGAIRILKCNPLFKGGFDPIK